MGGGGENMGNQEYQPTKREIWKSIGKDLGKSSKNFGKGSLDFIKNFAEMALYINSTPYYLPTFARRIAEAERRKDYSVFPKKLEQISEPRELWSALFGLIGGIGGIMGQVKLYSYLIDKTGHPLWIITPAASTISGLYELGRWINKKYKNTKERLISENSKKSLEKELE